MTHIDLAQTESDLDRCFPVMVQLRTHLTRDSFLQRVQRQFEQGYRLAYLEDEGEVKALAGFRITEMLYCGRIVYVDDLVTGAASRSRGYGASLFDWLVAYAKAHDCGELHLDSGVQRFDAHRYYFRQRMVISSYHFRLPLEGGEPVANHSDKK